MLTQSATRKPSTEGISAQNGYLTSPFVLHYSSHTVSIWRMDGIAKIWVICLNGSGDDPWQSLAGPGPIPSSCYIR